jgi:hypothetical protein
MDKRLANLTRRRKEKAQISKIRDEKGNIKTNSIEIQGVMIGNLDNLYSNKL